MRRITIPIFILALILATPRIAYGDGPSTHVVAWGETLFSISRKLGVAPDALARANGLTLTSWVYAGQRIVVPATDKPSPQAAPAVPAANLKTPSNTYTIRAGDTILVIAQKFGVSVDELAAANNMPPNGVIYIGWQLKIPPTATATKPPSDPVKPNGETKNAGADSNTKSTISSIAANINNSPAATMTTGYIVQPGDTLFRIAASNGVSTQSILLANNLPTPFVYSGQRLIIPSGKTSDSAANPPTSNSAAAAAIANVSVAVGGIPRLKQEQTLTCEEAAAAMVTRGALTEAQIVAAMPRSENPFDGIRGQTNFRLLGGLTHYGTYAQGLQKGLAALGRSSIAFYGQSYDDFKTTILEELRAGKPVIWWTTWREMYQRPVKVKMSDGNAVTLVPYEHTVVIVAANEQGITYNDPYDGSVRFTTWKNHQRASSYFNNMALVSAVRGV